MAKIVDLQDELEKEINFKTSNWDIIQSPKNHNNDGPLILENETTKITVVDGPLSQEGVLTIEKIVGNESESLKADGIQESVDIITKVYME